VEWTEDFESGLADIDVQHRYIFALIKRIVDLQGRTMSSDDRDVLEEIARFAHCHFACEERLMAAYNYPDSSKHVTEHAKLVLELKKYQESETVDPRTLSLFLCNWIVAHTLLEDRQLAAHVLRVRAAIMGTSVSEFMANVVTTYRASTIKVASEAPSSNRVDD
jgi:hemerythrin